MIQTERSGPDTHPDRPTTNALQNNQPTRRIPPAGVPELDDLRPGPPVAWDLADRAERQIATDLGISVEQWRQRADDLLYTAAYLDRPTSVAAGALTRCWRCGRFVPPDDATLRWVATGTVEGGRPLLTVGSFCAACESGGAR
jgi:hypothetical protein